MKTRSATRNSVKNRSREKISLSHSLGDDRTQIEKVYAERGKSNDNNISPIFNIHVHVTNSNKNGSHPSSVQPIIHLHIGEKELQKLSQKKAKSSPAKRVINSSPKKRGRKPLFKSPEESENKIVGNSDLKNHLITDYLTCATPLTSKFENKNLNLGISLDSKSEISNTIESPNDVNDEISIIEKDDSPLKQSSSRDKFTENNENNSIAPLKSPPLPSMQDYNIKEVSVVLKDIDCEKSAHNSKNCPKKINNRVVVTPVPVPVPEETNCVENKSETLNQDICEGSQKENESNHEQNSLKENEGEAEVSISKNSETVENNCNRKCHYHEVYSSSEESCSARDDINNEVRKESDRALTPSTKRITSNKKQSEISNYISKKSKKKVRSNLEQKFGQVETRNEKITNKVLSAGENTLLQAENLNVAENTVKESDVINEENCNACEFDSDEEIPNKNWSTESMDGYNFSEILQKLSGKSKNCRRKDRSASPLIRKLVQNERERLFSDKEKSDEKKEKENENNNESHVVAAKESSSILDKNKTQKSPEKNCILPSNDKNENFSSAPCVDQAESTENSSNNMNKCDSSAAESFSSGAGKTNVKQKKRNVKRKREENGASYSAQVNVEQTVKSDSDCKVANISDKFIEKEEIEVKQKKKKNKKKERDEISAKQNLKLKELINPFSLMDDKQVVTSDDSCTRDSANTVSLLPKKSAEEEENKTKKKKTEKSSIMEYFLKNSSETPRSSATPEENTEEANNSTDLLTPKKIRKPSEEGKVRANELPFFDAEKAQDLVHLKSDKVLSESFDRLENDSAATTDNKCEEEPPKKNESKSNSILLNSHNGTLLEWSSEESLFREKVKSKKHRKKSKRKKSSKCTEEDQTKCTNVNNSKYEQFSKTDRDSDDEPGFEINDLSESEISFFFDEIDCPRREKNKKNKEEIAQNEIQNFSPTSIVSTCSRDMFLSQELNMDGGKEKDRERSSTKKKRTENAEAHCALTETERRTFEEVRKNLNFNLSPKKDKVQSPVEDNIDDDATEFEINKTDEVAESVDREPVTNKNNKIFPKDETEDEGVRKDKLKKIKKWVQDNSSPPPVINIDQMSPASGSQNSFTRKTKKRRKIVEDDFEEEKSTQRKKKKSKSEKGDRRTKVSPALESDIIPKTGFEKTGKDNLPHSGVDNNTINPGSSQTIQENSDKCLTTQTMDLSFEAAEKEKPSVPKIFLKVTKKYTDDNDAISSVEEKKPLKSNNKTPKTEPFIESDSLDFQLDLIKKEMSKRGIVQNKKKKKKLKKESSETPIKENKVSSQDTIIEKSKRKRRKKRDYEPENSTPKKKVKTFEGNNYIPLAAEGPTKFSVAVLDKVKPFCGAASFKDEMLFGDRVKRFSKSNSLSVKQAKQKVTRENHSDY